MRSPDAQTPRFRYRDEMVDLVIGEEAVGPLWRQISDRRLVEQSDQEAYDAQMWALIGLPGLALISGPAADN